MLTLLISNFIKVFDAGLQCEFIQTFLIFSCQRPLKQWPKKLGGKVFKCQVGLECDPHRLDSPSDSTDRMYNADKKPVEKPPLVAVDVANNGESRLVLFTFFYIICLHFQLLFSF